MVEKSNTPRPGFQGSETSWAEVFIYSNGGDPILLASKGSRNLNGRYRTDKSHTLISVSTNKPIGGCGSFAITVKPSRAGSDTLLDQICDDDWVDIVFHRHGREWHTMRGIVGDVRRVRVVGSSGATSWAYQIPGFCFQRVFEMTPLWFNRFSRTVENVVGEPAIQVFNSIPNVGGDPAATVKGFLIGWFKKLASYGRANWVLPKSMPGTLGTFFDDISQGWNQLQFSGIPNRISIDPNFMNPQGNLWEQAMSWADPAFLELFCDLKPPPEVKEDSEIPLGKGVMSINFRDKPFVLGDLLADSSGKAPDPALGVGLQSLWYKLPLHVIPRQQIVQDDVGRSGSERINAFFVSPQVTQQLIKAGPIDMAAPLWNIEDIRIHGLRRYDIVSRYSMKNPGDLFTLTSLQRGMVRDWYALNPYFLNGSISLGIGRPEIRVGSRVRIPGDNRETSQDETYYVENVGHTWTFGPGLKTTLGVTRGWKGDDNSLLHAVNDQASRYSKPFDKGVIIEHSPFGDNYG